MQAALSLEYFFLAGNHFVENGAILHLDRLLLKVAHAHAFAEDDAARIGVLVSGDDLQHGGLAGTVRPHKGQTIVSHKPKARVGEQSSPAEAFRKMVDLHNHMSKLLWGAWPKHEQAAP